MTNQVVGYHPQSVDPTQVPGDLLGFRTVFSAFHHFRPEEARAVLTDAVRKRQGIGIFEATQRRPLALLLTLLAPIGVLVLTPFIRPFRWSRFVWTYLFPLVPLVTLFDGLVSCLRTYSVKDLHDLTASLGTKDYHWEIGTAKSLTTPMPITYLLGVPIEKAAQLAPRKNCPLGSQSPAIAGAVVPDACHFNAEGPGASPAMPEPCLPPR